MTVRHRSRDRPLSIPIAAALALATAAGAGSGCIGEVSSGYVTPIAQANAPGGVELHAWSATDTRELGKLLPNAFGTSIRQIGSEHPETEVQIGWAGSKQIGGGPILFGRLMFDLISWQRRDDGDRNLSAFSPTLELGVAPVSRGLCLSGEATWDVHIDSPDRLLAGVFVGLCNHRKR